MFSPLGLSEREPKGHGSRKGVWSGRRGRLALYGGSLELLLYGQVSLRLDSDAQLLISQLNDPIYPIGGEKWTL